MATPLGQTKKRKHLTLTCDLCKDESKKPKLLPCQHTFCTPCLVQHQETLDEGKPFCCPTCHKDIELRDDAVESLPDNYVYDIVKEAFGGVKSSEIKCISCRQIEKTTNATHKCLDCGDTMCLQCNTYHCRTTLTKHHVVVPLEELKQGKFKEEFSTRKIHYCENHSSDEQNVPLSSYCDDCECLVCITCIQDEHKGHDFTKPQDVREELQVSISNDFENLQQSGKYQQKRIKNIENYMTNTRQVWNEQETDIYNKATEIYAMVDKIKDKKLAELKSHYEKELQHLNILLEEENSRQSSLQATVAFIQEFLENSTDPDFLLHEKDVKIRMESSQRRNSGVNIRHLLRIKRQGIETLAPVINDVFGRMVPTHEIIQHKCRIGEVKKMFSRKVELHRIYGIAFNPDTKELVVSGSSHHKSLLVLDSDGTFKRFIKCKNADNPFDIYAKDQEACVTFCSPQSRQVCVIDANDRIRKRIKLPSDDQDTACAIGVVVDDDDTIFVSSCAKHRIYRMGPDENTLSKFLSTTNGSSLSSPNYLCVMPSGELVVSNYSSSNIQVYSKDVELLWQYNGKKEGNSLMKPSGVCCDEDGYIYVADPQNCRIQVIRDNEWIGNILMTKRVKDSLYVPLALTPEGDLVYGFENNIVKISFWE